MLQLIGLNEDLVAKTCQEVLARGGNDFSSLAVVFPNKRFGFFLRQELSSQVKGNFFPPAMYPVEIFFKSLFQRNFPGSKVLDDLEAAHAVYESARAVFPTGIYGGGQIVDFPSFLPWARKLLAALEEILSEDGQLENIDWQTYGEFTGLGDYHRSYKEFIQNIPALLNDFCRRLDGRHQATMGMVYHQVAALAAQGDLKTPAAAHWLFSGFNALNPCENKLFRYFFGNFQASLILRTDPKALADPQSPFFLQSSTIHGLGLEQTSCAGSCGEWNDLAGKVMLHPCDGLENEVYQAFMILQEICRDRDGDGLKKVAVLLPSSPTLIPFIQGVVSRFDQEKDPLPFNITLGYPLERTPVVQLIDSLLEVLENIVADNIQAYDYLQLIRHPYVKISAENSDLEPLKRGIHLLENIISSQNLTRFTVSELSGKLSAEIKRSKDFMDPQLATEIKAQVASLHQRFIAEKIADFSGLLAFLRQALASIGSDRNRKTHLFLNEYIAAAMKALAELEDFAAAHSETFTAARIPDLAALVRLHFHHKTIHFEGSPLAGVQVMGPLEFRGLSFDEVIILDALEGILPGTEKYDPLLPVDIRKIFRIRDHSDWEKVYAFNFFSLLGAARRVHILYTRQDEDDKNCERSRFIERIVYEVEKRTGHAPEGWALPIPFQVTDGALRKVRKSRACLVKLESLTLSPSSLETYVNCPLQFYFSKIIGLKEREEIAAETESNKIGTIAHEALRNFYQKYQAAGLHAKSGLMNLDEDLENYLFAAYRNFNFAPEKGLEKIRAWTLLEQLRKFVRDDWQRMSERHIQIAMLEKELTGTIPVTWRGQPVAIKGRIDRCEAEGELLRVIDYKTGNFRLSADNMVKIPFNAKALLSGSEGEYLQALNDFHKKYQGMQLLIYLLLMAQKENKAWGELDGAYVLLKEQDNFYRCLFAKGRKKDEMNTEEKSDVMDGFGADLGEILRDLYTNEYFLANPGNELYCSYCPFRLPCGNL
jgi:ATP-dependent helicase/nuclease subunit B